MYDLSQFALSDMIRCGAELRKLGAGASSMEEVGDRTVRYLYENLRSDDLRSPACVLVRVFVTIPFADLEPDLQGFAKQVLNNEPPSDRMKCLTLLATAGQEAAWNSRKSSSGHKALPLQSEESVSRSPMIAQLIRQLGVEIGTLLSSDKQVVIDVDQHTFNVFFVGDAPGSPYIPAQQEFVIPYGVRSVLGFGGLLPNGELFATVLFCRLSVSRNAADLFRTLALNLKLSLLPFVGRRMFA